MARNPFRRSQCSSGFFLYMFAGHFASAVRAYAQPPFQRRFVRKISQLTRDFSDFSPGEERANKGGATKFNRESRIRSYRFFPREFFSGGKSGLELNRGTRSILRSSSFWRRS